MQTWKLKPTIYLGEDSLSSLTQLTNQRVFIICDPFLLKAPVLSSIVGKMEQNHNIVQLYADVSPDPPIEDIVKGIEAMRAYQPDSVIAIGGGSAIDLAKGVMYFNQQISKQKVSQFIAIPTTSGTGSEVTNISVITDKANNIKYPLADDTLIPDVAILNVDLVMSAPNSVVSYSGLDVLTHALEALVATKSNSLTDALSEKAIELVFTHLANSYHNKDRYSREKMHEASCLAGMAFNDAGLGINHAIAHQLGGQFHIVHGLANAMLLPHVVGFNSRNETAQTKYAQIARKNGISNYQVKDEIAVNQLVTAIRDLAKNLDCKMSLTSNGITREVAERAAETLVENAYSDITTQTNPVAVTKNDLRNVYLQII